MWRDVLFSEVADWHVPAGSMPTFTANDSLLIFTCSSEGAELDRVMRRHVGRELPDKSHLDTRRAGKRKSVLAICSTPTGDSSS